MESISLQGDKRRFGLARMAVFTFFFANGVMTTAFSARLPAIQTKLALLPGSLGLALLGCTIGGLIAMNIAGRVVGRFGSKMITIMGTVCMGLALLSIAFAPDLPLLIIALTFFGIGNGAIDISTNLQAAAVERAYGRPIFNSFHASFSVGSVVSALLGSALAVLNIGPELHFLVLVICIGVGVLWGSRFLLPEEPMADVSERQEKKLFRLRFSRSLIFLGIIAFCALLSIGAMFDWIALYLSGTLRMGEGLAAGGFLVFLSCMALGRSVGDRLTARFGAPAVVRCACLFAAIGLVFVLAFTWMPVVFLGLGLVGVGLSVPFPLVLSAAGRLAKRDTGSVLATVTTWGYSGMIVGPALIGFIADQLGLRLALVLVVSLCVLAALCAPVLRKQEDQRSLEDKTEKQNSVIG